MARTFYPGRSFLQDFDNRLKIFGTQSDVNKVAPKAELTEGNSLISFPPLRLACPKTHNDSRKHRCVMEKLANGQPEKAALEKVHFVAPDGGLARIAEWAAATVSEGTV